MSDANLIPRMLDVIATGPSLATMALATNGANGLPIIDYVGNCQTVLTKFQEAYQILGLINGGPGPGGYTGIIGETDPDGDSDNTVLLYEIWNDFYPPTGLVSTSMIADMKTVISNGPQGGTPINAIAPGGEITDYVANCKLVLEKLQEAATLLGAFDYAGVAGIRTVTDQADPNLGALGLLVGYLTGTS